MSETDSAPFLIPPESGEPHSALFNIDVLSLVVQELHKHDYSTSIDYSSPKVYPLKNFCLVNKLFRNVGLPFLLRHLNISGNGLEDAWEEAEKKVVALLRFQDLEKLASICRTFRFGVHPTDFPASNNPAATTQPSPSIAHNLGNLLARFTLLQSVAIHLSRTAEPDNINTFTSAFKQLNITLPSVRTLEIGSYAHFLLELCPEVQSVIYTIDSLWSRIEKSSDTFISLGMAKHLKVLVMNEKWSVDKVTELERACPNLEELTMQGNTFRDSFWAILEILSQFSHLKKLCVPALTSLGIGHYAPRCGMAYRVFGNSAMKDQFMKRDEQVREQVTDAAFNKIKSLRYFQIDIKKAMRVDGVEEGKKAYRWVVE